MPMNLDAKTIVDIGQFVLSGVIAFFVWLTRRHQKDSVETEALHRKNADDLNKQDARIGKCEGRFDLIDAKLDNLIRHEDIDKIHVRLNGMSRCSTTTAAKVESIEKQLDRLTTHLMSRSDSQ